MITRTVLLLVALAAASLSASTAGNPPASCPRLFELFGLCANLKAPALERTAVAVTADAITETYTVRWTSDGRGQLDSMWVEASATGQPTQAGTVKAPATFPQTSTLTWPSPGPGETLTTKLCIRVKRRQEWTPKPPGKTCSAERTYHGADVPPPPVTIDTTIASHSIQPAAPLNLFARDQYNDGLEGVTQHQFCAVITFGDGRQTIRDQDLPACAGTKAAIPADRRALPGQQTAANRYCLDWHVSGPGASITEGGCDRVFINGVLSSRLAGGSVGSRS